MQYDWISLGEQLKRILRSRKFWVLLLALVGIAASYYAGNIDGWQLVQALIAALAVYSTGVAIEDFGKGK